MTGPESPTPILATLQTQRFCNPPVSGGEVRLQTGPDPTMTCSPYSSPVLGDSAAGIPSLIAMVGAVCTPAELQQAEPVTLLRSPAMGLLSGQVQNPS